MLPNLRHYAVRVIIKELKRSCANLNQNLMTIIETKVSNNECKILMPYLENFQTFASLNQDMTFSELKLRKIVKKIVKGLTVIHDQNLYHGNLKLSNIYIDLIF